jgi:hypothetical protein
VGWIVSFFHFSRIMTITLLFNSKYQVVTKEYASLTTITAESTWRSSVESLFSNLCRIGMNVRFWVRCSNMARICIQKVSISWNVIVNEGG